MRCTVKHVLDALCEYKYLLFYMVFPLTSLITRTKVNMQAYVHTYVCSSILIFTCVANIIVYICASVYVLDTVMTC